jgi:hypothetical protein
MLGTLYAGHLNDYTNAILEAEMHHADPHQKRELRIQSWDDVLANNVVHEDVWNLPGTYAIYKMKIFEVAKPGKTARMIGDLGCPASLQGFRLADFMKTAMYLEPLDLMGGTFEFCKEPSPSSLAAVFEKLIDPPGRFFFVYFSDDSCLAVRTKAGKILRFNVDISSCDASHTGQLFEMFVEMHPPRMRRDARKLVEQCMQPITVMDVYNRKRKITFKPKEPRLYSGVTITTVMNNIACQLIGLAIAESEINDKHDVIKAAAKAGYVVTCDDCENWHELQFLKHSPVLDQDGVIRPLLNIGVLLRLSGTSKGEYPGSSEEDMKLRCDRHQSSLLRGAYPKAHTILVDSLKATCAYATQKHKTTELATKAILAYKVVDEDSYPEFYVDSDEVYARYKLTELEVAELDTEFGSCGFAEHYASSGTSKILDKDYGLASSYLVGPPDERLPPHLQPR